MAVRPFRLCISLFLAGTALPLAAKPASTGPGAVPFRLGAFRLVALRDMDNVLPNDGQVFGKDVGPQAVAKVLANAGAPTDQIALGVDALLVEEPTRIVLLDTGLGPHVGGALPQSLAAAGIAPTKVTDILITHSHGDHVGGLVTADGALAFPNATIRMSAAEWAWMKSHENQAAIVRTIAAKMQTFTPGGIVVPGVRSVALPGHTPGHTGYEISSNGAKLLDMGDTAHSAIVSLAKPGWVIGYDDDPKQGIATREAALAKLAASHEPVFAPHFPFPGVGRIEKRGNGYVWQPGLPAGR